MLNIFTIFMGILGLFGLMMMWYSWLSWTKELRWFEKASLTCLCLFLTASLATCWWVVICN